MDITATLNEIVFLRLKELMFLIQAIWDSIVAEQADPDQTATQKQELDDGIDHYIKMINLNI